MSKPHPFDAAWDAAVKAFSSWDAATTRLLDTGLRSGLVLEPAGRALALVSRLRVAARARRLDAVHLVGLAGAEDVHRSLAAVQRAVGELHELGATLREVRAVVHAQRDAAEAQAAAIAALRSELEALSEAAAAADHPDTSEG